VNIFQAIEGRAQERADAPAILLREEALTFAQLVARVERLAATFAAQGVRAGDVVGVAVESSSRHVLVLLALIRLGAVSIAGHDGLPAARWHALGRHFRVSSVITPREDLRIAGLRVLPPESGAMPSETPAIHPGGEHPWNIALTSGTTGVPRGVALTHAEFLRLSALQRPLLGIDVDARFLCRMSLTTNAVRLRVLHHLCAGGAIVFTGDALPQALEAIDRHRVTHSFISPIMLQRWLESLPEDHAPFSTLRHLNVSGGALPEAVSRDAERRITPNIAVTYGTTEVGFGAQADPQLRREHPGSVGTLAPWIEAQAVDEHDRPLAAGESGTLRFRGLGVATGYYRPGGPTHDHGKGWFRDGWCYPGDVGRVTAERRLYIDGRADEVISLGGPKVNIRRIEQVLAAHPQVAEIAAFGVSAGDAGEVIAAVVPRGSFDEQALLLHCRSLGSALEGKLRIVEVRELPRNAMGKVAKLELASAVERLLKR
jgi:acyl-coenzyme A synthetase/AMP-(fatty) acid ligase